MNKQEDASQYYQRGQFAMRDNQLDKAAIYLIRAIQFDKRKLRYHFGIALVRGEEENNKSASSLYKIFLTMDPQNAVAYYNYGFILDMLGKIDQSIEMYKKALELNPSDAEGYYNLAIMFTTKEDHEEAQKYYLRALELQPSDAYKVSNCFGYSYFLQGEFQQAKIELQKAIDLNGKYFYAYCNMSLVFLCENKSKEAFRKLEEGMKMSVPVQEGDQNAQTRVVKDIIASYTSEKVRLETKLGNNKEIMDEEKTRLLKTLICGLVGIINLLARG